MDQAEFDQSRRQRRRELSVLQDRPVWFASPEDVILKKMAYFQEGGSEKHIRDITGVLRIQGAALDRDYIARWAIKLGLADIWRQILERDAAP